ncbi:MAG: AMP-binding protein, partial [Afipia sp.]|nr:AMP-binding protein [Afipia sp.]
PVGCSTFLNLSKEPAKIDTVGRPLRGVEVEIFDQDGKTLPPMTVGNIRIKSPGRATTLKGRGKEAGSDYFIGNW